MSGGADEFDRRVFLKDAAIVASAWAIGGALPAIGEGAAVSDAQWQKLVAFLTGKIDLSAELVLRGYAALRAVETDFEQRVVTLSRRIEAEGLEDVEALRTSKAAAEADLMATTLAIISAFYLGHVGKAPASQFVSYPEALMYRPTADATVVPTYSLWAPGYWVEPPKS